MTFAEGCTVSSYPRPNVFESCATLSAMAERGCLYFFQTRQGAPSDRRFALVTTFLPRDARSAKRGIAIVSRPSVCPSVCLSVTLTYGGHIHVGWTSLYFNIDVYVAWSKVKEACNH